MPYCHKVIRAFGKYFHIYAHITYYLKDNCLGFLIQLPFKYFQKDILFGSCHQGVRLFGRLQECIGSHESLHLRSSLHCHLRSFVLN